MLKEVDRLQIRSDLERHEGLRLFPYRDTVGKLTIGIGRNLEDRGISPNEAYMMLDNDIDGTVNVLREALRNNYKINLDTVPWLARRALVNMAFQLGVNGLMNFRRMLGALKRGDYHRASKEALDSRWARQTPNRAKEVANWIKIAGYSGELMT